MGRAISAVGGMGDSSLALTRAMGEVSNYSTADGLVGGLNFPEAGKDFVGPMSRNSVTGSCGNDGGSLGMGSIIRGISISGVRGIGLGLGRGIFEGLLGHVREDVMRTRSVDDHYTLAVSKQHSGCFWSKNCLVRNKFQGIVPYGVKWANCH